MAANRIQEWRERRGLTQEQLGELVGTTQATIQRLEKRPIEKVRIEWIMVLARALRIDEVDLLPIALAKRLEDDVRANPKRQMSRVLSNRGLASYVVMTDNVARAGFQVGARILIDTTEGVAANIKAGDVVLAQIGVRSNPTAKYRVLRQYVNGVLTTNRPAGCNNFSFAVDDDQLDVTIEGIAELDDLSNDADPANTPSS